MVTSIRKEGPPDLYRVLYERPASHGRGLSFVRLSDRHAKRRRRTESDAEGGKGATELRE